MSNVKLGWLADAFDKWGVNYVQDPKSIGYSSPSYGKVYTPRGVIDHHTAGTSVLPNYPEPPYYSWSSLRDKCNITIEPQGRAVILNEGYAYDSGKGSLDVLAAVTNDEPLPPLDEVDGWEFNVNPYYIDIEVQHWGDGSSLEPAQRKTLLRVNAAICDHYGWDPRFRVIGHRESAPKRKVDPSWDGAQPFNPMHDIRADTYALIGESMYPLNYGDNSSDVGNLQRRLNTMREFEGLAPLKVDDDFGPATAAAVRTEFPGGTQGVPDAELSVLGWWGADLDQRIARSLIASTPPADHGNSAHVVPLATFEALDEHEASPHSGDTTLLEARLAATEALVDTLIAEVDSLTAEVERQDKFDDNFRGLD